VFKTDPRKVMAEELLGTQKVIPAEESINNTKSISGFSLCFRTAE
jgi:hypothetical protein